MSKINFTDVSNECAEISKLLTLEYENISGYSKTNIHLLEEILYKIKKLSYKEKEEQLILRAGAYVGEVIRKSSKNNYFWVKYSEVSKVNLELIEFGENLLTYYILYSDKKGLLFPMAKVKKFLDNGKKDSLEFYVDLILSDSF